MSDLELMAKIPGVKSAVLGDLDGTFLDGVRAADGEALAAEMGFVASTLGEAGEVLGVGALAAVSVASGARACLVLVRGGSVITAQVEPARALAAVEKAVETSFQEWA
jgi:hypothetical protein